MKFTFYLNLSISSLCLEDFNLHTISLVLFNIDVCVHFQPTAVETVFYFFFTEDMCY